MENNKKIYIIGMGPGSEGELTAQAQNALAAADLLIGSERVMGICPKRRTGSSFISYRADEIADYIVEHPEYSDIAILYSGDIGFYSGAKKIEHVIMEKYGAEYGSIKQLPEFIRIPGIASPIFFMDKLGIPWEDAALVSNHGRNQNLVTLIRDNKTVCTLLGEENTVAWVCRKLCYYDMADVKVTVGERLSYEDEKITVGKAADLVEQGFDKLSVALFQNEAVRENQKTFGLPDEEFIRGEVPMTKQEVRTVSLSKLKLKEDSVVYDIGAGTGSVSVEAALIANKGRVYAIEKNKDALALLEQNRQRHVADNMEIISGEAPFAIEKLEMPTHAFIGGSGGELRDIVELLVKKNPDIRCVINCVTLETVADLHELCSEVPACADMELVMLSTSRGRKLGAYHLMSGENPVYIASFGGRKEPQS